MKITKSQLKQIIKEELASLSEAGFRGLPLGSPEGMADEPEQSKFDMSQLDEHQFEILLDNVKNLVEGMQDPPTHLDYEDLVEILQQLLRVAGEEVKYRDEKWGPRS
tara:strand:+ start:355 stop:675 length:321 start_codon:yes stop_codon:yes gene_type:complete